LLRDCVCADIPTVPTRTRIVIVRHLAEANRSSNTARLAHLALPNSEIVDHARMHEPIDPARLAGEHTWLLFPEGAPRDAPPEPPPERLIILDATWHQARRMRQRIAGLRGLPVLRLPDVAATRERMRESPGHGLVSTIEAIARALRLLEGDAAAAPLERLFDRAVRAARSSGRSI
jgi:DTW domain-containing protein YfiP